VCTRKLSQKKKRRKKKKGEENAGHVLAFIPVTNLPLQPSSRAKKRGKEKQKRKKRDDGEVLPGFSIDCVRHSSQHSPASLKEEAGGRKKNREKKKEEKKRRDRPLIPPRQLTQS